MTFPSTINTMVSASLLTKISRFTDGGVQAVLTEIIQNARRAGAKRIDITQVETDGGPMLRIRDDGCGIADPVKFLALGDSGWDETIARSEDPAGMGVFSLAGHHVSVRSHAADHGAAWQVTIPPHAWETGQPLDVVPCSLDKGTEIEIDLPEAWAQQLEQAVKSAARF
ncbi:ATP-binding protein, partial [Sphingobium sp.]|uniref:ATP-binding protein n=2 Tax=Sphingobium TaxID=165695 RepID=UPI002B5D7B73